MAVLTCGSEGSTVAEVIVQINDNTLALDYKYGKTLPSEQEHLVMFGPANTLQDSDVAIEGILLVGEIA